MSKDKISVNGPQDLLQALPYMLGYQPQDSLVLAFLKRGTMLVTSRMNLSDVSVVNVVNVIDVATRHEADAVILVVYGEPPAEDILPWFVGVEVKEYMVVNDGRYRSLLCSNIECCPPEGKPIDDTPAPVVAELVTRGATAEESRDSIKRSLAPAEVHDGARELAKALADNKTRDVTWYAVDLDRDDRERLHRWVSQLSEAARHAGEYAAPLYFLAGWAAYRAGDGARSSMLVDYCLSIDPEYVVGKLLLETLIHGISPESLPPIPAPQP